MTTWAQLRGNLVIVLGDENRAEPTWADGELLMYANYALDALAEHTAQEKDVTVAPSADLATFTLPGDLIALGPVRVLQEGQEQLLTPRRREAGRGGSLPAGGGAFYEWDGALHFLPPLPAGATLAVAYYGYWDALTGDASPLGVPRWMEEALLWACLRHCMSKPGVQAAQIRPWNTRQDSGSPEDNPALIYAEYCRKQYERILANHPVQDRTGWESK